MKTSSTPFVRVPDGSTEAVIGTMYRQLLAVAGIRDRFYCRTGLETRPWMDCVVTGPDWLRSLRAEVGESLDFVSHDMTALAMTFDDEHELLGFFATAEA